MRISFCLLSLAITSFTSYAQIKGKIQDSVTKEPIPFVNIWVEGENNGTTADENGNFSLAETDALKNIMFSAVGYGKKNIKATEVSGMIYLTSQAIELNELVIDKSKNNYTLKIGSLKKPKMTHYAAMREDYPVMQSNYYSYKKEYENTPYFKTLKLITYSDVKSAIFNLRFYTADKDGKPGDFLYDENIICNIKKGKNTSTIDLSQYNIKFPESGVFVTIEWLVLERNRYYYTATSEGHADGTSKHIKKADREKTYMMSPSIGATDTQADIDRWMYIQGVWSKQSPRPMLGALSFEIILTN